MLMIPSSGRARFAIGWGFIAAWGMVGMLVDAQGDRGFYSSSVLGVVPTLSSVTMLAVAAVASSARPAWLGRRRLRFALLATVLLVAGSVGHLLGGAGTILGSVSLAAASFGYVILLLAWGRIPGRCRA